MLSLCFQVLLSGLGFGIWGLRPAAGLYALLLKLFIHPASTFSQIPASLFREQPSRFCRIRFKAMEEPESLRALSCLSHSYTDERESAKKVPAENKTSAAKSCPVLADPQEIVFRLPERFCIMKTVWYRRQTKRTGKFHNLY